MINIPALLDKQLEDGYRHSFTPNNRASELGFDCDLYQYFSRTVREKPRPPTRVLRLFHEGNRSEKDLMIRMLEAGIPVEQSQRPFYDEEHRISGHMDLAVRESPDGQANVCEAKNFNPWMYAKMLKLTKEIDGVLHMNTRAFLDEAGFIRKYPGQIQLYIYFMEESETGLWVIKDRATGEFTQMQVELDYDFVNDLLARAKRVNAAVEAKTPPPMPPYEPDRCDRCDWMGWKCLQEKQYAMEGGFIIDEAIDAQLEAWFTAKQAKSSFDKLDKALKARLPDAEGTYLTPAGWSVGVKINRAGSVVRTPKPPQEV